MFNSQTLIRPRLASRLEKPNELWTVPGLLAYRVGAEPRFAEPM